MRKEMFDILILCGGKGTRLGKQTENKPKSMVEIEGKPFIWHQLELLEGLRFKNVFLCLGHMSEQIVSYVSSEECENFDLNIEYVLPPQLRGTGGDIKFATPYIGDKFFILYGDSYLPTNYRRIQDKFERGSHPAIMTIHKNQKGLHANNVLRKNKKIVAYSKENPKVMNSLDYGISIFTRQVFEDYPSEVFSLGSLFSSLIAEKKLGSISINHPFYEIGTPESLRRTKEYFKSLKEKDAK